MHKYSLYLFFVYSFIFNGNSQEVFHQKITTADGLPSNSVYDIMQDNRGFVWFATDEGVSRFDGRHFKSFKSKSKGGKSGSFLKKDNFGRVWYENFDGYLNCIAHDSVLKLDHQAQPLGFVNFSISKNQLIYATQTGFEIRDLKTLKSVKKQILPNFQTCFLDNVGGKTYFFDPFLKIILLENKAISVSNDFLKVKLSAPIFTKSDAVYCTDKNKTNNMMYKVTNGLVTSLFEFKSDQTIQNFYFLQNKFWICTNKGLFVLDKNGKKLSEKSYFSNYSITTFFIDHQNNFWIGTLNDGVFRCSNFNEIQLDFKQIKPLLLSQDRSKMFLGTEDGKIHQISNDFENLNETAFVAKHQILYINHAHPNFNFVSSDGFYTTDKNFKILDKQPYALKSMDFINANEAIVAVSGFIGFYNFGKKAANSEFGNFQYAERHFRLKENVRGKTAIWNGADQEALFLTNTGLYSFKQERLVEVQLPDKKATCKNIKKANNNIYVLTDDDKLYQYSKNIFTAIKTNSEPIISIKSIDDKLFAVAKNAVYELTDRFLQKIEAIKISEKILDLQADDHFWYVLNKSNIVRFSKGTPIKIETKTNFYIEKVFVNDDDYTLRNKSRLSYSQNNLKIQLAMLDFEKQHSIFYRINKQSWKEILNNGNILELSSLSPNQYQIEFSDRKNGIILSILNFEILKPFWEQSWFYVFVLMLITFIVITIYYNRLKAITAKKNLIIEKLTLENYLNESKVKLIKAQMNPHFFFNALNTIQSYIATNETAEATEYLKKFSRLTRMILEMTDKNWISIEDELRMQTLYLDLQQIRLSDFSFEINIENQDLKNLVIPTMLLQPYIENAIIHGLTHKIGHKKLGILFEIKENKLQITIIDNGVGLKKSAEINIKNKNKSTSFATKATLERLEIINREDYKISVYVNEIFDKDEQSQGTEVILTMNLRYD